MDEEFYNKYIVICSNSADYLLFLVNDFLTYQQIKMNKKLNMVYERVKIRDTIMFIKRLMDQKAKFRNIDLIVKIAEAVPETFCTEQHRLQ